MLIHTGYHRKHASRVRCNEIQAPTIMPGPQRPHSDEVRGALITPWVAARICGKPLSTMSPIPIIALLRNTFHDVGFHSTRDVLRHTLYPCPPSREMSVQINVKYASTGGRQTRHRGMTSG